MDDAETTVFQNEQMHVLDMETETAIDHDTEAHDGISDVKHEEAVCHDLETHDELSSDKNQSHENNEIDDAKTPEIEKETNTTEIETDLNSNKTESETGCTETSEIQISHKFILSELEKIKKQINMKKEKKPTSTTKSKKKSTPVKKTKKTTKDEMIQPPKGYYIKSNPGIPRPVLLPDKRRIMRTARAMQPPYAQDHFLEYGDDYENDEYENTDHENIQVSPTTHQTHQIHPMPMNMLGYPPSLLLRRKLKRSRIG